MKIIKINTAPYNFQLTLIVEKSEDVLKKYIEKTCKAKFPKPACKAQVFSMNGKDNGRGFFVWFKELKYDIKYAPILAHEAFHIAVALLGWAGIRITDDSDEAYAYFLEDVVKKILEGVR